MVRHKKPTLQLLDDNKSELPATYVAADVHTVSPISSVPRQSPLPDRVLSHAKSPSGRASLCTYEFGDNDGNGYEFGCNDADSYKFGGDDGGDQEFDYDNGGDHEFDYGLVATTSLTATTETLSGSSAPTTATTTSAAAATVPPHEHLNHNLWPW